MSGATDDVITLHGRRSFFGCGEHRRHPSISLPLSAFDELVVMRFAEFVREDKVLETVTRLAKSGGFEKFGSIELANV